MYDVSAPGVDERMLMYIIIIIMMMMMMMMMRMMILLSVEYMHITIREFPGRRQHCKQELSENVFFFSI